MLQRIVTGVVLALLLIAIIFVRGWVFDFAVILVAVLGCYEMLGAFKKAELRPACWAAYGMAVLMYPAYLVMGTAGVYVLGCVATMVIMLQIALRKEPRWVDAAASLNVLISVPIPLAMLYPLVRIQPDALGALMVLLVFVIALLGDTFAYFIGSMFGRHPMAPELSPKKTWEGAAASLLGSVVGAVLVCLCGDAIAPMPPVWHFVLLGLVGGVAGQLGDLTASLVKRFCGIKDFGTLFPGHGGMMDRVDSVIFVIYIVFGYSVVAGLL